MDFFSHIPRRLTSSPRHVGGKSLSLGVVEGNVGDGGLFVNQWQISTLANGDFEGYRFFFEEIASRLSLFNILLHSFFFFISHRQIVDLSTQSTSQQNLDFSFDFTMIQNVTHTEPVIEGNKGQFSSQVCLIQNRILKGSVELVQRYSCHSHQL
eukprot:06804.XXX_76285_76746_1 [CDS] Oithona nana genome sequencing.